MEAAGVLAQINADAAATCSRLCEREKRRDGTPVAINQQALDL